MLVNPVCSVQINLYEAKTRLSELVEAASQGQVVTIGKAGKPMARLGPIDTPRRRVRLGLMKGRIRIAKDFDAPLSDAMLEGFEGSSTA